MEWIIKILVNALAVLIAARLLSGVEVKTFGRAIIVALVLALLNTFLLPVAKLIFIPLTLITFGLFLLVINGGIVYLTSKLVDDFNVKDIWWAMGFSLLLSLVNGVLFWLVPGV
ncbi:MAG: phage holin family protein [Bacteroidota bacterium]